jgi:hypothetical protein
VIRFQALAFCRLQGGRRMGGNPTRQRCRIVRPSRCVDLPSSFKDELEERIDRVRDLRNFRFQVVELRASANEEQVAEIFVRINSRASTSTSRSGW